MKTLIFGFSRPIKPTLFAKAIMWSDKSNYDHCYIKWTNSVIQRDIYYQASNLAVNFESNISFLGHAIPVEEYELDVLDEVHAIIMRFCIDNSNKPYGVIQIVGDAYIKVCKILGFKVHNPFPSYGSTYVCSKIAASILQLAGIQITQPLDDVDPLDVNNIIKAAGLKKIL
jgi:hypothetical protein